MGKMRKWERDYEKYSNSIELDERIGFLQNLVGGNQATKDEWKELKKLEALKENLPKVKNILELREKLNQDIVDLKKELERRDNLAKLNMENENLETEMAKLQEENEKLEAELKNAPEEKKSEIKAQLADNKKKRLENNSKYNEIQDKLAGAEVNEKYKDMSTEELRDTSSQLQSKISRCNLACNKLMQGYSWKSIEVSLDKFENEIFKANGKNAEKMKQNREAAKNENTKSEIKPHEEMVVEFEEKSLVVQNDSEQIKAWLKKVWTKITGIWNKEKKVEKDTKNTESQEKKSLFTKLKDTLNNIINDRQKVETVHKSKTSNEEQNKNESKIEVEEKSETKQDSFRQYLKEVAEKGLDGIEQEKIDAEKADKEARRQAAIKKLIENRTNARGDDGGTIAKLQAQLDNNEDGR